ncbi:MAG: CoA transferase [Thermoleophilaceae bacterium]|nr:CoA transferase [Thermoleophilaceae bacterium]
MTDSHKKTDLPLRGVRVLDLSRLLPGPFCSLLLADLGAEVLKVEDTGMGDYLRWAPPYVGDDDAKEAGVAASQFLALNRNKRSVRIDLKSEAGQAVLLKLATEFDVLLESFRPGVLDRLGVGYEALRAQNKRLIYCAISGYGQDGPLRDRAGHDMNYLASNGLLALSGDAGGGPAMAGGQIADIGGGGQMAALAITTALFERERSGEGSMLDVSMTDGAMSWLAMPAARALGGEPPLRRGKVELGGSWICYRPYEVSDGWVALGAIEPKFWQAFCRGIERDDLMTLQFQPPGSAAHAEVEAVFRGRTRAEWVEFGAEYDCCLEPVLEIEEALESQLVRERGMVVEIDQPGIGKVRQLASPVKIDGQRPGRLEPAPAIGQHTDEVLGTLGYTDVEIAQLRESGAVG